MGKTARHLAGLTGQRRRVARHMRYSERWEAYLVELECGHTAKVPNVDIKEVVCQECPGALHYQGVAYER